MSDAATPSSSRAPDSGPAFRYTAALADQIEQRWQTQWDAQGTFVQPNPGQPGFDGSRPKFFCMDMFPYPSGAGLHVGHPEGYTATDIICRYRRMKGYNVLHPMGWDAFGLPAEQYAIQTGVHPVITTRTAIDTFRRQLKRFGFSYDWTREFATIDEDYYRWTQWIFLRLYNAWYDEERRTARPIEELIAEFKAGSRPLRYNAKAAEYAHAPGVTAQTVAGPWENVDYETRRSIVDSYRLAYVSEQLVNWCPKLGTALANEEVIDGRSERGGFPVIRKPLRQWMMRITAYADRLIEDMAGLDWPESTRTQQAEWIGRSEGAEIDFPLVDADGSVTRTLRVYTTRPDTIFGATYMVIAPEHPLVATALEEGRPETDEAKITDYITRSKARSDVDRQTDAKTKTGVFSGIMAVNPATGEEIPVWIADYVLMGYGHGAIMAVPAHDERDYEFARQFNLPIRDVLLSRVHWAMSYFARTANADERSTDAWTTHLADFLGLVTSTNAEPDHMPAILARIRDTRRTGPDPSHDQGVGKRGSTQGEWLETVAAMGFDTFAAFERAFTTSSIVERFGIAYSGAGHAINSANKDVSLDGLTTADAKGRIIAWLESQGIGRRKVNYKLRDWLFSRQRYWGEPFPIVYDERGFHYPVSASALPVTLPPLEDFKPEESENPQPLLAKAKEWMRTTAGEVGVTELPPDTILRRETNTMPGWAGSCWYYLRYCDAKNSERFVGKEAEAYWMKGSLGRSALRADSSAFDRSSWDMHEYPLLDIEGFVARDPYPPGQYGAAADLERTHRNLPHYPLPHATYFVSWRTLPGRVLTPAERTIALDSLCHFDGERARVYAACVMPDHIHWLVKPNDGIELTELITSIKRYSATAMNQQTGETGSVWQPDRFDHVVRDRGWFADFLKYIVRNPVEDGLVTRAADYEWTFVHDTIHIRQEPGIGSESRSTQDAAIGGVDLYIGGNEHAVLHLLYARFWHKVLYDLGDVSTAEPFQKLFHQGLITSYAYQRADKTLVPSDRVFELRWVPDEGGFATVHPVLGGDLDLSVDPASLPERIYTKLGKDGSIIVAFNESAELGAYSFSDGDIEEVVQITAKMSKSLKNVVNPDDVIDDYGADTFRLYEMYMGPLEASKPWNTRDISGLFRFLQRLWRLSVNEETGTLRIAPEAATGSDAHKNIEKLLHRTTVKVEQAIEKLSFNTAIASMIELVNAATSSVGAENGPGLTRAQLERLTLILCPFAPHMAEELWSKLHAGSKSHSTCSLAPWPTVDDSMLRDSEVELAVQVQGKVRARITVPADADDAAVTAVALADPKVAEFLAGKPPKKVIVVKGRMVNVVV